MYRDNNFSGKLEAEQEKEYSKAFYAGMRMVFKIVQTLPEEENAGRAFVDTFVRELNSTWRELR